MYMFTIIVLASRESGCLFGPPNRSSLRTSKFICEEFLKMLISIIIEFFLHHIIPMTLYKDTMQCLSQDLETGCLKLAVVKFLGVQIFKGDPSVWPILIFQP